MLSDEDFDKIERHITKKYSIKFWSNGHHYLDHFIKKLKMEDRRGNMKQVKLECKCGFVRTYYGKYSKNEINKKCRCCNKKMEVVEDE